jgi:hypothetical protein
VKHAKEFAWLYGEQKWCQAQLADNPSDRERDQIERGLGDTVAEEVLIRLEMETH